MKEDASLRNRRRLLIGSGIAVLILIALAFVISSGGLPKFVSGSTESQDNTYLPRPVTTLAFDKEIESEIVTAQTFPDMPHSLRVNGKEVIITPLADLFDGITYEVRVSVADGQDSSPASIAEYSFDVPEFTERRQFLNSLPLSETNYSISRLGERTLYILVTGGDFSPIQAEVLSLLESKGITEDGFDIDIDRYDPSTIEPGID